MHTVINVACLSVDIRICLSAYISQKPHVQDSTNFILRVTYGHSSVFLPLIALRHVMYTFWCR